MYLIKNLGEINEINSKYNFVFFFLFFFYLVKSKKKNLKFNKPHLDQYHLLRLIDG